MRELETKKSKQIKFGEVLKTLSKKQQRNLKKELTQFLIKLMILNIDPNNNQLLRILDLKKVRTI
jgi:uncharacterized membrane protein YheB (UPF0754 family)